MTGRKRMVLLTAVLVIVVLSSSSTYARRLSCFEEYEIRALANMEKSAQCMAAALAPGQNWLEASSQLQLCELEFASDSLENTTKYAACMSLDVLKGLFKE